MKPSLFKRLLIYQRERFPVLVHLPLIGAFSFSAIAYSRLCRGADGFIPWQQYAACVFTNFVLFFLLRVSDEHKDKADDAAYRSYLPVPRGLVTLKELAVAALILLLAALVVNVVYFPALLPLFLLMMGYLGLMRYEFFIPGWLRSHQVLYNLSHMIIIPLADVYASGYDWKLQGYAAPTGLLFFFGVSYLNGMVLEIGRKIRTAETEEPNVVSYTRLWGRKGAPAVWLGILALNFGVAMFAAHFAGHDSHVYITLAVLFAITATPAFVFLARPSRRAHKAIELVSLIWALGMYLSLGGIPLLIQLISGSA